MMRIRQPFRRRSRTGVSAANWRVICPCQKHSRREPLRRRGALLIAGSFALIGAGFPLDAFDLTSHAPDPHGVAVMAAVITAPVTPVPAPAEENRESGAIAFFDGATRLGKQALLPSPLMIESTREQFFRTEVPFGEIIYREAKSQGLSPELVAAVVQAESDFRPLLISHKSAHGLMQVLPSTAALMGVHNVLDPTQNIRAGTRYLRHLNEQFDDPVMVLAAYNAGPARVRSYGGVPPYRETRDYVKKVDRNHKRYQKAVAERIARLTR